MLPKIIIVAVLIFLGFFAWRTFTQKQLPVKQHPSEQNHQGSEQSGSDLGRGVSKPFYSKDGLSLTHTWPGEEHFSNEETEVLIFNESDSSIEVKSFDLTYSVEGRVYPHKSGTWEKFPSNTSWDRMEYTNISPQYYKGEPLILTPGQKGKLHWHINFGSQPLDGKQTVMTKLTLFQDGKSIPIEQTFTRDSGMVVSKGEH